MSETESIPEIKTSKAARDAAHARTYDTRAAHDADRDAHDAARDAARDIREAARDSIEKGRSSKDA